MMQVWKIDGSNFYVNETYFVKESSSNEITEPILVGYVKPKWNGNGWVEGATEEEIQEWKVSQPTPQPTEIELLRIEQAKANAEMIELMMSMLYGGGF